jgi:hypothetical protein
MERRDFLKGGGAAGVGIGAALGGGAGCVPRLFVGRIPDARMKEILAQMDAGLDHVSRYDMLDDIARRSGSPRRRLGDADRELSRTSLRTLYTSALFRSLPEEAQLHPAMQERMVAHLPEMDDAVFGMSDRMSGVPPEQRDEIRSRLQRNPRIPEQMSEGIDRGMAKLHMPIGRRFQMRSLFAQVGWRMQNQSPSIVIDEYVHKVTKATAQIGSQAELQRRIAAQMGQESYWRYQDRLARMLSQEQPGGGAPPPSPPPPAPPTTPPGTPQPEPSATPPAVGNQPVSPQSESAWLLNNARTAAEAGECRAVDFLGRRLKAIDPEYYRTVFSVDPAIHGCRERERALVSPAASKQACPDPLPLAQSMARRKVMGTGGWMMGIGAISGVVGLLTVGSESSAVLGAISLTLGAVLLIGGLIVLIVGAGMAGK